MAAKKSTTKKTKATPRRVARGTRGTAIGRPPKDPQDLKARADGKVATRVYLPLDVTIAIEEYVRANRIQGRAAVIEMCALEGWRARTAKGVEG